MLMGNRTDGGHLNEDCSDRTADRKRSTNLIWWKRTRRVVFDRGAGQAGAPGHAFRKWRFIDLRRARPVHEKRVAAYANRARPNPVLHDHARQSARTSR